MSYKLPTPGRVLWIGTFPGHVYPLPRPRFVGGRVYQPLDKQRELRAWLRSIRPREPWEHPIWIDCFFMYRIKREADCDNLLKAVFDALQATGWIENDRKILGGSFARMHGAPSPSCSIILREVDYYDSPALPESSH